jgi:hypothetical protein
MHLKILFSGQVFNFIVLFCSAYKPTPMTYKGPPGECAVVDKVLLTSNDEQQFLIKVLFRHTRRPEVCDCNGLFSFSCGEATNSLCLFNE